MAGHIFSCWKRYEIIPPYTLFDNRIEGKTFASELTNGLCASGRSFFGQVITFMTFGPVKAVA